MEEKTAIKIAEAYGVDLSLIWDNLRMTPTERLYSHRRALNLFFAIKEAGENARQRGTFKITPRE